MKRPEKRNGIAENLSDRIVSGALPAGSRLPTEEKLAAMLQVSRDTVRHALRMLEDRQLIDRIPGRGTFVRMRENPSGGTVTFLLPCAEILTDRIGYRTAMVTRELLSGVIREAGKRRLRVETIAVSPSNRNDDIDWMSLEHLNRDSKVIIYSFWYAPLFEFLAGKGVRTGLITLGKENEMQPAPAAFRARCFRIHDSLPDLLRTAADFLRGELDCRRICRMEKQHPETRMRYFDLACKPPCSERIFNRSRAEDEQYRRTMKNLYERSPFDGLLLSAPYFYEYDYSKSLNRNLGLPERVRILMYLRNPYPALRNVFCLDYDFESVGAAVVRGVCQSEDQAAEQVFLPFIKNSSE